MSWYWVGIFVSQSHISEVSEPERTEWHTCGPIYQTSSLPGSYKDKMLTVLQNVKFKFSICNHGITLIYFSSGIEMLLRCGSYRNDQVISLDADIPQKYWSTRIWIRKQLVDFLNHCCSFVFTEKTLSVFKSDVLRGKACGPASSSMIKVNIRILRWYTWLMCKKQNR